LNLLLFFIGTVKKAGVLKIIHEKYLPKKQDMLTDEFYSFFEEAIEQNPEIKTHMKKAQEDMNPLKVLNIFEKISAEVFFIFISLVNKVIRRSNKNNPFLLKKKDCEVLGLDATYGRPENLIWTYLPVPPCCIRPSVAMDTGAGRYYHS